MADETDDMMNAVEDAVKDSGLLMMRVDDINKDSMVLVDAIIREHAGRVEAEERFQALLQSIEQMNYLTVLQIQEQTVKLQSIKQVATNAMDGELGHREAFNYIVDIVNTEVNMS